MEQEVIETKQHDVRYSWVSTSRFLFYLEVFAMVAFLVGGSYGLYTHRYKGHPKVSIPDNTLYSPKYK
ncbi:MAG: hypothetical protein IT254_03895 [Chitinophagaceae bacterium]|nr:hypothetical protein [Bacteroidota bacterium]MCC6257441.1 hypothetical protein [Chitinophagaceae bacterium]MCW5917884.1 hypothetical protein [Ferruginibacter sp.]